MRALSFSGSGVPTVSGTEFCCECNLCTLYACPEDLDPKSVCYQSKQQVRASEVRHALSGQLVKSHPMLEFRRAPLPRLIKKLGLHRYDNNGPLLQEHLEAGRVVLPLKQHVGAAATPCVRLGDKVRRGQKVADVPSDQLGVPIHASISGRVSAINPEIVIEA
jgi:Na+-translocating ferredoxin:NAD+ oxidoreductase RnfC subunit